MADPKIQGTSKVSLGLLLFSIDKNKGGFSVSVSDDYASTSSGAFNV